MRGRKNGARKSSRSSRGALAHSKSAGQSVSLSRYLSAFFQHRGVREVCIISLIGLGLFLFLALASHNLSDSGWRIASEASVTNKGGVVGAWLADILFTVLGVLAWGVPLMMWGAAFRLLVPAHNQATVGGDRLASISLFLARIIAISCVFVGGAALATLHLNQFGWQLPESAGGILGSVFSKWVVSGFSLAGATLVLTTLFFIGLSILEVAWLQSGVIAVKKMHDRMALLKDSWYSFKMQQADKWQVYKAQRARRLKARMDDDDAQTNPVRQPTARQKTDKKNTPHPERIEPVINEQPAIVKVQPIETKIKKSKRADSSRQGSLFTDRTNQGSLPSLALLDPESDEPRKGYSADDLHSMSKLLELKLLDFGIKADVEAVLPGPVITRFEIQLAPGIKVSRISNLAKDLARSLAVLSVRVVEVIPGKTTVGIEIPNAHREIIKLSEVLSSKTFDDCGSHLALALGKDISGQPVVANLAKMPHILVAGTTGSGKSVGLNAMLISMLYKATPEDLRLIMIDPKMLELSVYDDIPHLLTPVVTDMKEAANSLRWCVAEMERRYKLMAAMGVRNLASFNRKVGDAIKKGEPIPDPVFPDTSNPELIPTLVVLPKIVVVIDEFADMMMIVGKKVEELIARIAQKARAAGIHLILATQRPSVDVITGLIKANVPARVSFQVSSKVDSRTILDQGGAEQLLGHGDMLYLPPGSGMPVRVHGAFVDDDEVHRVCDDWRDRAQPNYLEEILTGQHETSGPVPGMQDESSEEADPLYDEAVQFVLETRRASISAVQRRFRIGYNRSARLIETMERAGLVSSSQSNGSREVLAQAH